MMEELKIGDAFNVVRTLNHAGYPDKSLIEAGRDVVATNTVGALHYIRPNGKNEFWIRSDLAVIEGTDVKPVGRLVITKVK